MTKLIMVLCASLCTLALVVAAIPARAAGLNSYSYVASNGSDNNPCTTPATACETITYAITTTQEFGEVDCVDTGYYEGGGSTTITQSVTINCAGTVGAMPSGLVISGDGIVVILRNLNFNINGEGAIAIDAQNMAALYIENCLFSNYTTGAPISNPPYIAIKYEPTSNSQLFVVNSTFDDNGTSGNGLSSGLYIVPGPGATAEVLIDHSQINGNYFGIVGDGRQGGIIKGTITDSVVSGSTENGITALSSGSSTVFLLDQTKVTNNAAAGVYVSGSNAGILARNSIVYGNAIGLDAANGGTLYTYGNNSVNGNATNGAFTGTAGLQ
jgi:hypothetical protein